MLKSSISARAENILRRARREECDVGVFVRGEEVISLSMPSDVFNRAMKGDMRFVGVYGPECDPTWLRDDLLWALGQNKKAA